MLRNSLKIQHPVLKHALIVRALLQLIHNSEPNLVLVQSLLVTLLQHFVLCEALILERGSKLVKVIQCISSKLSLPLTRKHGVFLPGSDVCCESSEVALKVGVDLQHWQAEDRLYLRLDTANLRFVVVFDAVLGIKVQRRSTPGVGRDAGIVDGGSELVADAAEIRTDVFTAKKEAKHATADFAARVADFGVRGLLEGQNVGRGKGIEFGFPVGAKFVDVLPDTCCCLLAVSLRFRTELAYVQWRASLGKRPGVITR